MLVTLGTLVGVLTAVRGGTPGSQAHSPGAGQAQVSARSQFNLPKVRPSTGDSPVVGRTFGRLYSERADT